MLTTNAIDALFAYSTEDKKTVSEQKEKNNRRVETILVNVPEVRTTIYESNKGVPGSIQIVNERYSSILINENISKAANEILSFERIISSMGIDMDSKASIIKSYKFTEYNKILNICKINGVKSICRLNNMKLLADKFINRTINTSDYNNDLDEQLIFFSDLNSKYKDICSENFYAYVLRFDLKTIKKRTQLIFQDYQEC